MRVHITVIDDDGNDYEGSVELTRVNSKPVAKAKQKQERISTAVTGPAGAVRKLYNQHFFKTYKSIAQVMKQLDEEGIHFTIQLISMALYRAKYLTKKGTKGNYTYVQKQPPG